MTVDGEIVGEIGNGILVLLGVASEDSEKEAAYLWRKHLTYAFLKTPTRR